MKVRYALKRSDDTPLVLAIGFFDGMHRGHHDIARQARRLRKPGWSTAVLTFAEHPSAFLRPGSEPPLITTSEERIDLFARAGYEECFFIPFDAAIATQTPEQFLRDTLIRDLGAQGVVVGKTFRFGKARAGDVGLMADVFGSAGVAFAAVENTADENGERISSTRIRELIANGDIAGADDLLGHAYELRGSVEVGAGRGHDLGFPTANIRVPQKMLPKDGVYAGIARHEGRDHAALVSIGTNPTFNGKARTVEAWLRDFHDTIYGQELILRDLRFVRDQRKFENADDLLAQMQDDAKAVPYPAYG
ncbi:MAG TPA: riboflavin biosynthesis protein RibF [Candidatus Rubrimentiphilum sp.]|nr:riboflavin biosynthesis protein RibF [Candidatus Rubrimentiphilum sp.]